MTLHVNKKGFRVLGIAESFVKTASRSQLVGVVMRRDLKIDGFGFARIAVGGDDATDGVLKIYRDLNRRDINALLLNGTVISWFNIIDIEKLYDQLDLPVISLTYEESNGLENYILEYFSQPADKIQSYRRLGDRQLINLKTGFEVYIRSLGATLEETKTLLNCFTLDGRVPEPLRVARLLARTLLREESNSRRE
ncbi:MAG: endonuclease dU [Methanotrichaceae archaeon]